MKQDQQIFLKPTAYQVRDLYDRYAGMLLGYIYEIVKDRTLAEQYLINTFNVIPQHISHINEVGCNVWLYLQRLAKAQLSGFLDDLRADVNQTTGVLSKYSTRNKYLGLMSEEQQVVFCNIYYHGKSTASLSQELNRSEESVRKVLKEAFAIMRRAA